MKKEIKKVMLALSAVLMLAGCSAKEEGNNQGNITLETPTEATQPTSEGQKDSMLGMAEDNYIDYNKVCSNIIIDGTAYSMPFTYDDIKKNYDCEQAKKGSQEGYYLASLKNKDGKKLVVEIKDTETNGEELNDKPITSVMVSAYTNDLDGTYYYDNLEETAADVSFDGVKLGMTLQEVQKLWAASDMYQPQDKKGTAYTYMSMDKKMTVQVMCDKDEKVYSIAVINHRI